MFVYLMMLAASVVLGVILCDRRYGRIGKAIYCAAGAIAFTVISASRYLVGYDFNLYGQMYVNYLYMDFPSILTQREEKGFAMPMYLLGLLNDDYYALFIFTSVVIYFSVFWLIYKNSSVPWISVSAFLCLGLYFCSLDFLRQFIAGIIVTYALKFIPEKKHLYFFTLVFAACSFHWSALIMLALYFLIRIKPGYVYTAAAAAGTVLAMIFSYDIMDIATSKIFVYQGYKESYHVAMGLNPRYTVIFGAVFIAAFLFRKRLMAKNPSNGLYINLLMYTVIFEALGMKHSILSRFAVLTFLAPVLYLIPDMVIVCREFIKAHTKSRNSRFLAKLGAASAASVFGAGVYLLLMSVNYNGVMPYRSVSERDIRAERPYLDEEESPADEAEIVIDEDEEDDGEYFAEDFDFDDDVETDVDDEYEDDDEETEIE